MIYTAEDAVAAIERMIRKTHKVRRHKGGSIPLYVGPELSHYSITAMTPKIVNSITEESAADTGNMLRLLLYKCFQLGYNQACETFDGDAERKRNERLDAVLTVLEKRMNDDTETNSADY